jgi:hypothetical protein
MELRQALAEVQANAENRRIQEGVLSGQLLARLRPRGQVALVLIARKLFLAGASLGVEGPRIHRKNIPWNDLTGRAHSIASRSKDLAAIAPRAPPKSHMGEPIYFEVFEFAPRVLLAAGACHSGIVRNMKVSNIGTVKAVSPNCGL